MRQKRHHITERERERERERECGAKMTTTTPRGRQTFCRPAFRLSIWRSGPLTPFRGVTSGVGSGSPLPKLLIRRTETRILKQKLSLSFARRDHWNLIKDKSMEVVAR